MPRIIVLGGGLCGLAAGLLLRRDGHDVTVLERDAAPVPSSPEAAWDDWDRAGVTQFRQNGETVEEDRAWLAEIEALRHGLEYTAPPGSPAALRLALTAAAMRDPDVFRAFLATRGCLRLQAEVCADEGFLARVLELARDSTRPPVAGPDRPALERLLAGSLSAA